MEVTLSGMVIEVRLVQLSKAQSPMEVTLFGMEMEVRLVHDEKADLPMEVTDLPSMIAGISNAPDALSSQSVIVTVSPLAS